MRNRKIFVGLMLALLVGLLYLTGCGTTSSSTSGPAGGSSGDGKPFMINGTLSSSVVQGLSINSVPASADYVYAVNTCPDFGSIWRKKAKINADGSFSISLTKGDPWVLAFIDSHQTGAAMIKWIFKAESLDSIAPKYETLSDSASLGTLQLTPSGNAMLASSNYTTFIGNLGMGDPEATVLGSMDDLMLRYINPDIDGNGILDMDENLDIGISIRNEYSYGDSSLITNYISKGIPLSITANVAYHHGSTEVRINNPASHGYFQFPPKWKMNWSDSGNFNNSIFSGVVSGNSVTFQNYNPGGIFFSSNSHLDLYTVFDQGVTKVPDGTYTYEMFSNVSDGVPTKTLTFTQVKSAADASNISNYVLPFPVLNVDASDNVTSIDYTWMKSTGSSFVQATAADVERILGKNTAEIKWNEGNINNGKWVVYTFKPYTNSFAVTGNITYDKAMYTGGAQGKRSLATSLGIGFFTKLGINVFLSINML